MREMKDSGIEWIGAIPQDWQLSKIGSLYTQRNEKVSDKVYQPLSVTMQGILPQLATAAKTDDGDNRKLVRVGDFAINSRSDRRGSCGISPLDGSVSLINIILTPRTAMHPGYYNWLFHTTLFADEFYKWGHGIVADLWTTRWQEMKSITVPVPPLAEQERIAAFLDAECAEIDAVLEKTRASIEEYRKLKQAVITQAVTKGIRGDRPMKDSGIEWIGEIPAEWKVNLIKNVATTGSGGTPESGNPSLYDGDINWICSYDLKERPITKSERRLTQLGADSIAGNVQLKGSVLVAMYGGSGTIGNSGILECEAKTNQAICSIKFNNGYITDYFGFYYILSIRKYWMIFAVGTRKDPNISQDIVRKMPCILPPIAEQEEIVAYCNKACDQLDTLITKKQQYLTEIETYKKSLIYEYVTGKKEVV